MARISSLAKAIKDTVRDGDTVALEGVTHLIPHAAMANAYEAGAAGLPCAIFRGYIGGDPPKVNAKIKREQIQENTGWPVKFAAKVTETPAPAPKELEALRDLHARTNRVQSEAA